MKQTSVGKTLAIFAISLLLVAPVFAHPGSGIVVTKLGEVFFMDTGRGIWKIDNQGKLTYVPSSRFHWLAIDEVGHFAESSKSFGGWFERVTPQSSKPVLVQSSDFPLIVNRDGNIYYADTRPGSQRIMRRRPDGTESVLARGETFQGITGITPGPDGSLYVTDASRADANAIRKIAMDGTVSMIAEGFADKGDGNDPPPETPAGHCRGLAVDSLGVVYVAATGRRCVLRITPQGEVSTILEDSSPWSPTGVAVFQGEVYVLEWRDSPPSQTEDRRAWIPRVRKVGRDGTITTLASVSR